VSKLEQLEQALRQARRRLDDSVPYSPEWQAAIEAVVDLQQLLAEARSTFAAA
jgi:hypothetical protein